MVSRGAQWCGVANPEKTMPQTRCQKNATATSASKTWFAKLPSGVSLLYPKQCIAMETVPCDHPVIFHEFCLCTAVSMSAKWGIPVPNLYLLVMLCHVFVGECIGKVINFKWLNKNINADASNLIGKAKFIVAVVGPVTSVTWCSLNSRQVQGTLTLLLQLQICVTRWHHIMHAPVLQLTKNPGSPSGPPRWYPGWSAIILGCPI